MSLQTPLKHVVKEPLFPSIHWQAQPFVRLLLPLVIGILVASYTNGNLWLYAAAVFTTAFSAGVLYFVKPSFLRVVWLSLPLLGAIFAVGWLRTTLYDEQVSPDYFASQPLSDTSFIVGYLVAPPVAVKRVKARVFVQAIGNEQDTLRKASGYVFCYLDSTAESASLRYGDVLSFRARVSAVESPKNPMEIDLKQVLHYQNIHHRAFIKSAEWTKIGENEGNIIMRYAYLSQAWCVAQLKKWVRGSDNAGVASALIIGFTDDISDEIKEAYINTGAMHVLSVSGLHVGLVYALLEGVLRRIRSKKKAWIWVQMLLQLVVVWGFALATGASAAVLRAAVMLSMVIIGKALDRQSNTLNVLAAAAFLLLVYQPYLLFNIGFQLSFLAVAGLLLFFPPIYEAISVDFKLKKPTNDREKRRNKVLKIVESGLDWAWQVTAVGLAAQIATLPLSLYYFHQFPMYFWLSGWAVIPLATFALWLGMVLFLVAKIPILNMVVGFLITIVVYLMNTALVLIEKLPFALLDGLFLSPFDTILFYFGILALSFWFFTKNGHWNLAALFIFTFFMGKKAYFAYENSRNSIWIVHHSYKKTVIGAIDYQKATYYSETSDKRSLDFLTKSFLLSKNITTPVELTTWSDSLKTAVYFAKPPFYQYKNLRWLRLTPEDVVHGAAAKKLHVDYVVLSQNPKIDLAEISQQLDYKLIIADGSCAPWNVKRWQQQASEQNIPFWNTKEKGVFLATIE